MRSQSSRPSPAIIVAALALTVALAGTAIAAPDVVSREVSKSKVKQIAKKQAKRQISLRALSNDVVTRVESDSVPDGGAEGAVATCDPGETMIGGGATPVGTGPGERVTLVASGPVTPGAEQPGAEFEIVPPDGSPLQAWGAFMRNEAGSASGPGGTATLNVFAVCSR